MKETEKENQLMALDSRLYELEQQIVAIEKQISELQICENALDEIKKSEKNAEMFASLGGGIFVKVKLQDTDEVLINLGEKIFCKKNIEEAKEFLESKIELLMKVYNQLSKEIETIITLIQNMQEKDVLKEKN